MVTMAIQVSWRGPNAYAYSPLFAQSQAFTMHGSFTVGLYALASHVFDEVYITKPVTSRPASAERCGNMCETACVCARAQPLDSTCSLV